MSNLPYAHSPLAPEDLAAWEDIALGICTAAFALKVDFLEDRLSCVGTTLSSIAIEAAIVTILVFASLGW